MRSISAMTFVTFSALFGAAACSSSPSPGAPAPIVGSPPVSTAECDDFSSKLCSGLSRCAPALLGLVYGDATQCTIREKLSCSLSAQAPGVKDAAADVTACGTAIAGVSCDAFFTALDKCPVSPGTLSEGAGCATDAQCASAHCSITTPGCGVCAATIASGGACDKDPNGCVGGTACNSKMVCTARVAKGGSCANGELCETPYVCAGAVCAPGGEPGDACGMGKAACDSLTARCDTDTNKCIELGFANPGEQCGLFDEKVIYCGGLGACAVDKGKSQGTCLAATGDGEACSSNTPGCTPPAQCMGGTCTVVNPSTCK